MEYLLGLIFGSLLATAFFYINKTIFYKEKPARPMISQSRTYAMLAPFMLKIVLPPTLDTQSTRFYDKNRVRILYTQDFAYWIENNAVYRAKLENEMLVENSEEKLDIMSMSEVELEEITFIIEKLTEGINDDRGHPGN